MALTPLGKVAEARRMWFVSAVEYTTGGVLSSAAVGVGLAFAGGIVGADLHDRRAGVALIAVGVLASARELWRLPVPLPQMRRATRDSWARRWGHPRAAFAWGFDIGAFFTTWLTFAGAWWFVLLVTLSGSLSLACGLMTAYWAGRAAVIWLGPLLVPDATITPRLPAAWYGLERPFQVLHAATLVVGAGFVGALTM